MRLDRFSPLFEQADRLGVTNVRPMAAYHYVYPFPDDELARLVYFSISPIRAASVPTSTSKELPQGTARWQAAGALDALIYLDDGEQMVVADGRSCRRCRTVLGGLERSIYLLCEDGASLASIWRSLSKAGCSAESDQTVRNVLEKLVELRLVIALDDRYLALAINGNARLEMLAEHLTAEVDPPADLQAAVRRMFDNLADVFGHHLIQQLDRVSAREQAHG